MHIKEIHLDKTLFFIILIVLVIMPFLIPKIIWIANAEQTTGILAFRGQGMSGDQIKEDYTVIYFKIGADTIWFNGLGNIAYRPGEPIPVRYQPENPSDARVDILAGIWGDTFVNAGIPVLILLAIYIHPKVVPWGRKIKLIRNHPYILLNKSPT